MSICHQPQVSGIMQVRKRSIISINRGKLARAGLLTVPAVARSGDRPQLPNLLRRYLYWLWLCQVRAYR